jgi:hypothetical protein
VVNNHHFHACLPALVAQRETRRLAMAVKRELRRYGLLPFADTHVPSVVSLVAGGPVFGSWWGHPSGSLIYQVGEALDDDPEVLVVRLWGGKLTLVHRRLWPALVKVGRARVGWQLTGLDEVAYQVLILVDRKKTVRGDRFPSNFPADSRGFRHALRTLDDRLLLLSRSIHTSTGAHTLEAESWAAWVARTRTASYPGSPAAAQLALEDAARRLAAEISVTRFLPWGRKRAMR